jgi:hypothetical protein
VTDEWKEVASKVKHHILASDKLRQQANQFHVTHVYTQVVAGLNIRFQIRVNEAGDTLTALVWRKPDGSLKVSSVLFKGEEHIRNEAAVPGPQVPQQAPQQQQQRPLLGGFRHLDVTPDLQGFVEDIRDDLLARAHVQKAEHFTLVAARSQVVAGLKFRFKIKVGSNSFIHATVWRKPDRNVEILEVQGGKTVDDEF